MTAPTADLILEVAAEPFRIDKKIADQGLYLFITAFLLIGPLTYLWKTKGFFCCGCKRNDSEADEESQNPNDKEA